MTIETKSAFARRRGRSPSAVGQWIKAGILSGNAIIGQGRQARIAVEEAERQLARKLDPGQQIGNGDKASRDRSPSKPVKPSKRRSGAALPDDEEEDAAVYAKEKARLARAQADAQELKNAQSRAELVSITEVGARWSEIIAQARSRMLAVTARVRDAIPHLTATEVTKIDAEIRKALTDLGRAEFI